MPWYRRREGRHRRRPARTAATPAAAATAPASGRHEVDVPTNPRLRTDPEFAAWYQGGAADTPQPLRSRPRPVAAQSTPTAVEQVGAHQLAELAQARRRTGPPTWPQSTTPAGRHQLRDPIRPPEAT